MGGTGGTGGHPPKCVSVCIVVHTHTHTHTQVCFVVAFAILGIDAMAVEIENPFGVRACMRACKRVCVCVCVCILYVL